MKTTKTILAFLALGLMIQSCKTVDLRTLVVIEQSKTNLEVKGKAIIQNSFEKMGYDKLANTSTYETTATFKWKEAWLLFPMNAFPGNNKKDIQFRFATNTFDGQVEYLEGRKKGTIQGLQSWQGYKNEANSDYLKQHKHDRYIWGLATYHYILESPLNLKSAEIIRYAGERKYNGNSYDLVYVTWGSEMPNKQYDRFLFYFNKSSGFLDLVELTIGDFFLSMPKGMQHATIQFERKLTDIGTYMPSTVYIQLKKPKNKEKHVYQFSLRDYKFDSFDTSVLYPIKGLQYYGDSKKYKNDEM